MLLYVYVYIFSISGKTLDQAASIKNSDIAKELCLPPVKLHCSSTLCSVYLPSFLDAYLHFYLYK